MASQAVRRVDPNGAKGIDATFAYDWSPSDVNRNNTLFTVGLRFNEPLPARFHNTMSLGYIQNRLSHAFVSPGAPPFSSEHAIEFNALLDVLPMLLLQPVIQFFGNDGGGTQHAVVVGFTIKVEL